MKSESDKKPPIKRTIRFPAVMFERLEAERALSGRTLNEEVVNRLRVDEIDQLRQEIAELKDMIREVLDHVRK